MNERGATLLEVLIGGTLVAIAAVATALMFSMGQSFIQSEGDNRVAVMFAQKKIEQVRAGGLGPSNCCQAALPCDGREEPAGTCPVPSTSWATDPAHPGYRYRVEIAIACPHNYSLMAFGAFSCPPGFSPNDFAKRITVTVQPLEGTSSTDQDRMARPVVLHSFMATH